MSGNLFKASAGTVIMDQGKILMVQEAKASVHGKWSLPSGHVEINENILDAAVRETKEETGLDVKLTGFVATQCLYNRKDGNHYFCFFFTAEVTGGEIALNKIVENEIMAIEFLGKERLLGMEDKIFRGKQKEIIKKVFAGKVLPLDVVENYSMK